MLNKESKTFYKKLYMYYGKDISYWAQENNTPFDSEFKNPNVQGYNCLLEYGYATEIINGGFVYSLIFTDKFIEEISDVE